MNKIILFLFLFSVYLHSQSSLDTIKIDTVKIDTTVKRIEVQQRVLKTHLDSILLKIESDSAKNKIRKIKSIKRKKGK